MFSGGKFLEEYATRRASSVLNALGTAMPQIAHRIEADNRIRDIATEKITVGDKLAVHPHGTAPRGWWSAASLRRTFVLPETLALIECARH